MFLNRIAHLNNSLIFRLTIWYTVIFAISSFVFLSIFYFRIQAITIERTDKELMEEISEFAELMQKSDLTHVKEELFLEAESEPAEEIFFRLLDMDGREIGTSDLKPWGKLTSPETIPETLYENKFFFETLTIPGHTYKVRSIYSLIGPNEIMQIGISLKENDEYLNIFRTLLFLLMPPIFILAMVIGWFMAKKALVGVEEVSQTATEISRGLFDKRVQVNNRSTEVDRLAVTFNHMVDQLQDLVTAMRDMTDNIAHDLRSPLARIRGIAEMTLLSHAETRNFEEMAASTIEECDNLIDLINTTLDISEAEAGVIEIQLENLDLSRLISDACDLFKPLVDEKNIRLHMDIPENIWVKTDKHKLQRIVTNLLENSIKYTPEDGHVSISVESQDTRVNMVIKDTGIGISKNELPYIFNRFYRCDASRSQAGIGLGLSLVKVFTEALEGRVTVSSEKNQGSVFTVVMPAFNDQTPLAIAPTPDL
jgi:signal transduction histidine kinase